MELIVMYEKLQYLSGSYGEVSAHLKDSDYVYSTSY